LLLNKTQLKEKKEKSGNKERHEQKRGSATRAPEGEKEQGEQASMPASKL
jgi:hypothetical protein